MTLRKHLQVWKKDGKTRRGRGFSRGELKEAGISLRQAVLIELPVDSRRRTVNAANAKLIKRLLKKQVFKRK